MDFTDLLKDLLATGNTAAINAGIKALKAHKNAENFTAGEWGALERIKASEPRTAPGKAASKLLRHRPHNYIAEW